MSVTCVKHTDKNSRLIFDTKSYNPGRHRREQDFILSTVLSVSSVLGSHFNVKKQCDSSSHVAENSSQMPPILKHS